MKEFKAAYLPVGIGNFDREEAKRQFEKSKKLLERFPVHFDMPKGALLDKESLTDWLSRITPDFIIFQNITFANGAYVCEAAKRFSCPILLWSVREPESTGRLKLNSLTGAFSAGNMLMNMGRKDFFTVQGGADEIQTEERIGCILRAAELRHFLKHARLAVIGHAPQGFGFGQAKEAELQRVFGVELESAEARQLMKYAEQLTEEEEARGLEKAEQKMKGLKCLPEKNVRDFARLYKAYEKYAADNRIHALASRCWPDYFVEYGTPVCAVLSMLNDEGIAAACEADCYGALSMLAGMHLTGKPVFFGDPAAYDEWKNTIVYWHCGTGACSLARNDTGAQVGVQCNRGIGPAMEFGCKSSDRVTIFRIGQDGTGAFRFFLMKGRALDAPKQYSGTSVVVQVIPEVKKVLSRMVTDGWEPHFTVIFADVAEELEALARMLSIEVVKYE